MALKIGNRKDFYAGLIFIFFGIVATIGASNYSMGTAARMGPGYFPFLLGSILVLLGLIVSARSLWMSGEAIEPIVLRPLLLATISVLAFTFMVEPLGLVLATLALVVVSSLGGNEFRLREVLALSVSLIALGVVLFVYILSISLRVWPRW